MSREQRRSKGKRRMVRECHRDVVRVLELAEAGRPPKVIATSVGLSEDLVGLILAKAGETKGEGAVANG